MWRTDAFDGLHPHLTRVRYTSIDIDALQEAA